MSAQKFSLANTDTAIWAEPANLNYFLKTPLEPDGAAGVTNVETRRKAHQRRQYKGDPTLISVPEGPMTYMVDPGRKSGSALPGKPFVVTDGIQKRQMRYVGSFMDVHAMFVGDAKFDTDLFSATGTRYSIAAAGEALVAKTR